MELINGAKSFLQSFAEDLYGLHFNEMVFICGRGFTVKNDIIHSNLNTIGDWNDTIAIFDKSYYFPYDGTVDASMFWVKNPMVKEGAAMVLSGLTKLALGSHRGREAYVQVGDVFCYRDTNKNAIWEEKAVHKATGCNLHAAHNLTKVDRDSACCTVPRLSWESKQWKEDFVARGKKTGQKFFYRLYIEADELSLYIGEKFNKRSTKDFSNILFENRQKYDKKQG
jgi:hypothetical protein